MVAWGYLYDESYMNYSSCFGGGKYHHFDDDVFESHFNYNYSDEEPHPSKEDLLMKYFSNGNLSLEYITNGNSILRDTLLNQIMRNDEDNIISHKLIGHSEIQREFVSEVKLVDGKSFLWMELDDKLLSFVYVGGYFKCMSIIEK